MNFSRQREIIYEQVRNFPVHPKVNKQVASLFFFSKNRNFVELLKRNDN